MAKRQVGEMR